MTYLRRCFPCDLPCSPCHRTHSSVASSVQPLQRLPLLHTCTVMRTFVLSDATKNNSVYLFSKNFNFWIMIGQTGVQTEGRCAQCIVAYFWEDCVLESITSGRTDSFSNILADRQFSADYYRAYLSAIYNSSLLFSHGAWCRNWFSQLHFHFLINRLHFSSFDRELWPMPWPSNTTWSGSRWTRAPNVYIKGHFVLKLSSERTHAYTHTHAQIDRLLCTWPAEVVGKINVRLREYWPTRVYSDAQLYCFLRQVWYYMLFDRFQKFQRQMRHFLSMAIVESR